MTDRKCLSVSILLLFLCGSLSEAQTGFFRTSDLKPGMKGTGKTCFQGSVPEEFQVEILGVMRGAAPGAEAVLARLTGGALEHVGVFEGMSGSPVFIDGKLLGAVAFSFPFAKEAVAGITPIQQMVDAFTEAPRATIQGPRVILKKSMLWEYQLKLPEPAQPFGAPVSLLDAQTLPPLAPYSGHALTPIATPLSLGGVSAETIRWFAPQFRALGLSVLQGSGGEALQGSGPDAGREERDGPLEPGSNIVVPLIRGDLDASAAGTVTHIQGDKIYAFGHPLFNLGFSELPLHKGRVITVFPSLQNSFKIVTTTEPVGALLQDRGAGIFGLLGRKASMIPLRIQLTTSRGVRKTFNYEIASDRFLTPFMINLGVFNTIVASERVLGVSTLAVKARIRIKGQEPLEVENRFVSDSSSPALAALSIALPVNFILASGFADLQFEDINVQITVQEDDRGAVLYRLGLGKTELRAGEALDLEIVARRLNGETIQDSYPIRIPPDIPPGQLMMLVADGTAVMQRDAQEQGDEIIPRDLAQLIKFINNIRKNDRLYVRIFRQQAGAVVRGESLPGLPPSILSILKSERNTGSMNPIQTLPLMEYELPPSDYVISGSKVFTIMIRP